MSRKSEEKEFCFKQMKLYKIVLIASLFLIIVPLIIHYYLVNVSH